MDAHFVILTSVLCNFQIPQHHNTFLLEKTVIYLTVLIPYSGVMLDMMTFLD